MANDDQKRVSAHTLLVNVVLDPPRSREAADALDAALSPLAERPPIEDFLVALVSYSPMEQPLEAGLLRFEDLRSAARTALHDLGDHQFCAHCAEGSGAPSCRC